MPDLFSQHTYQRLSIKNRVIRSATNDYSGRMDGGISDVQMDLYERLAATGIGLIVTGNFYVSKDGQLDIHQNAITEQFDDIGAKVLVKKVHEKGAAIVFQIAHAGRKSKVNSDTAKHYDRADEILVDEIQSVVNDFKKASLRCKEAGADGVQVHFGHGYLLDELLNEREDGLLIAEDIFREIRKELSDYPVLVKINSDIEESCFISFCLLCQKYGIWAIELSGNDFVAKTKDEHNYYQDKIGLVKKNCSIPVIMTGGIRSLSDAQNAMDAGAEMIGMSRPFISEPDLLLHWRERKSRCISCCRCFSLYGESKKRCVLEKDQ